MRAKTKNKNVKLQLFHGLKIIPNDFSGNYNLTRDYKRTKINVYVIKIKKNSLLNVTTRISTYTKLHQL